METLFLIDKRNYRECQTAFRGQRNREYYSGEYSVDPGSVIEVRADRRIVGSCSIIRLCSRTRQVFRRSWSHIREDATDVAVLCFVRHGRVRLTHQCGETLAEAGDFLVSRSTTPFSVESLPDSNGQHEILHLTVPMHLLRTLGCHDVRTGFHIPVQTRALKLAERLLAELFEDEGELAETSTQLLLESVLSLLGEAIRSQSGAGMLRQTLGEKRLQDVLRYIETHLSDPRLCVASVARGCGISSRYLSLLLKVNGTPFSTLLWDKRLKTAGQWLANSRPGEASISEVAYRVGFKSPAHFSRMFKREFKLTPRQYRGATPAKCEPQAVVIDGGDSRH